MTPAIVLTGAAGRIGTRLRAFLASRCAALRLVDLAPIEDLQGNETAFQLDLNDQAGLQSVMQGAQAVVHFAGHPREADWPALLQSNISGVISVWEAARLSGVGRMLYASSNHAVGMYPRTEKISHTALPAADSRYGVTKVFMETLARLYADKHGMRSFGMRIGHCSPAPTDARMLAHWIHPDDLCQLIDLGLTADYQHELVYGVSANSRSWWANHRAEQLGYRPAHSADAWVQQLEGKRSTDPVAEHFQGGSFAAAEFDHPEQVRLSSIDSLETLNNPQSATAAQST